MCLIPLLAQTTWQLHHIGTDISSVVSVASQLSPKKSDAAYSCRGGVTMHRWCLNSRDLITAGILTICRDVCKVACKDRAG